MKLRDYVFNPITIAATICGAVLFACVSILGSQALDAYSEKIDSGVQACKIMAKRAADNKPDNKQMTLEQYNKARKPFEKSSYADIRVAGTNLLDTVYKADTDSLDKNDLGGMLALYNTLQTQWGALQMACGNHGVTLPPLPTK